MRTLEISKELLDSLRTARLEVGAVHDVRLRSSSVDEGAGLRDLVVSAALAFATFQAALPGDLALQFSPNGDAVRFRSNSGQKVEVLFAGEPATRTETGGWMHEFRLKPGTRVAAVGHDGKGFAVEVRGDKCAVAELAASAGNQRSDVAAWCAKLHDPWLESEVASLVAAGDTWSSLLAVALFHRCRADSLTGETAEKLLRDSMDAGSIGLDTRPADFLLAMSDVRQAAGLQSLLAEAGTLNGLVADLIAAASSADAAWADHLLEACRRRDHVQAVRNLVAAAVELDSVGKNKGKALKAALNELDGLLSSTDEAGSRLADLVPRTLVVRDEALERTASVDWMCWWVTPVLDPQERG